MLRNLFLAIVVVCCASLSFAQNTFLKSQETKEVVPYATISFGNGNGLFGDDQGGFYFTKKLYPDIDSLFISALGFKELKVATANMTKELFLEPEANKLKEVIVKAKKRGKFKVKEIDPVTHDDYFHCWLPTIESEIAVFFRNEERKDRKLTEVYLPIKSEASNWKKRKSSKTPKKKFSTLFRVKFYENENGLPGESLLSEELVFEVTDKNAKDFYTLNVDDKHIYVPSTGIFVSVQVLGYTDDQGKLLPNKKYREVKTKKGIVKVSTTFRPLLPFTNEIAVHQTYVKRIFLNGGKWVRFEKRNIQKNNKLLLEGYKNYGIGIKYNEYLEQE